MRISKLKKGARQKEIPVWHTTKNKIIYAHIFDFIDYAFERNEEKKNINTNILIEKTYYLIVMFRYKL